jgi:fatty-acyl-CoA synthase
VQPLWRRDRGLDQAAGHSATVEELQGWCKARIAHFKVPRHIRFVEEYPMTVTGKVQKFRMREISVAEISAVSAG